MNKPEFTLDELLLATYDAHKDAESDMLPENYAKLICDAMKETVKQYIEDEGLEAAFPDLADEKLLAKAHNEAMFDQATANDEALIYHEMNEDEARHIAMNEDPRDYWNDDYLEPCESCGWNFDAGTNECPNCEHLRA